MTTTKDRLYNHLVYNSYDSFILETKDYWSQEDLDYSTLLHNRRRLILAEATQNGIAWSSDFYPDYNTMMNYIHTHERMI